MQTFTTKRSCIIIHNPKLGFLHYSKAQGHAGMSRVNLQWVNNVEQATILYGLLELDYNTRQDLNVLEADWVTVLVTKTLEVDI
jgi:hypothetical protein